jgi:outer membrane receptor protein involved in Fe transport
VVRIGKAEAMGLKNEAIWFSVALVAFVSRAAGQPVETVIVTAAPPDPVGSAAFSVVRLDAAALNTSPQLDTALSQVPGLSLFRRNSSLSANPTTQGVSLRSIAPSGAGRALVTLDGVPQNDPFGGWVIWSALPAEDIAEAQVVRGAGAGPYGAGALTGVIALKEASSEVHGAISGGSLGQRHATVAGGKKAGLVSLFASVSETASDGWLPVSLGQRGSVDDYVTLEARNASLRAEIEPAAGTLISARVSTYREGRHSGIAGTHSQTGGILASITVAHLEHDGDLGWRLQVWLHDSDFSQTSASVAPDRMSATPSNDQYATPAFGWGGNAAVRGSGFLDWEFGADLRAAHGNAKEHVAYVSGAFTQERVSGGKTLVGGLYAEAARHNGDWLLTLGVRADAWSSSNGRVLQTSLVTGTVISDDRFPSRSGLLPTVRAGLRRDFDSFYLRTAAYEGFRAPSLNELYRPFRLGNNVTAANPALLPEKLYGLEIGAGGAVGALTWDLTAFWNQLHAAITNVTIGQGPGTFPGAGFVPAGGLLIQRQNAGDINAPGIEGSVAYKLDDLTLRAAFDYLDQRVHGGSAAPQLAGKRPSQAPRATITAGAGLALPQDLLWSVSVRYESNRWADDANTMRLGSAVAVSTRLSWTMTGEVSFYVSSDNLLNMRIATSETADGVFSYDAPRTVMAGVELKT